MAPISHETQDCQPSTKGRITRSCTSRTLLTLRSFLLLHASFLPAPYHIKYSPNRFANFTQSRPKLTDCTTISQNISLYCAQSPKSADHAQYLSQSCPILARSQSTLPVSSRSRTISHPKIVDITRNSWKPSRAYTNLTANQHIITILLRPKTKPST